MNITATGETARVEENSISSFLPQAYLQGNFLPFEQAHISIATHALHYGTAVLGGIRGLRAPTIPNQVLLFRLDAHCQRLSNSTKYLGYSVTADFLETTLIDFCLPQSTEFSFLFATTDLHLWFRDCSSTP